MLLLLSAWLRHGRRLNDIVLTFQRFALSSCDNWTCVGYYIGNLKMLSGWVDRGGLWVWGQNFLTLAVLALGPIYHGQWQQLAGTITGAMLLGTGAVFGLAGTRALGRNRTPYPKPLEAAQLVEHGIYALVRHPLYSSLMLMSLGWASVWRSWPALVAALVLAILLDAKARLEERYLREQFTAYDDYARRVRRFIPKVY